MDIKGIWNNYNTTEETALVCVPCAINTAVTGSDITEVPLHLM
jgi:hypothetical protein